MRRAAAVQRQQQTWIPELSTPGESCPAIADSPWKVLASMILSLAASCAAIGGSGSGVSICELQQLTALLESSELELDGCAHSELRNSDGGVSGDEWLCV